MMDSINRFGPNNIETIRLYIESTNNDYEEALATLDKENDFKVTQLQPINKEISRIQSKINELEWNNSRKEKAIEEEKQKKETEETFKKDKKDLETNLYNALENIHSKIPKEAYDVGMTTESAIATYLPLLLDKVGMLEHYISELDRADTPYKLSRLQREIDSYKIFVNHE